MPSGAAGCRTFLGRGYVDIFELSSLDGSNGFQISGEADIDFSGGAVASAGDVNGDGLDDLIIGAHGVSLGSEVDTGASYVVFGQTGDFPASIDLADLDGDDGFQISGEGANYLGFSVASAGDINGDGFDDLIIGAATAGYAETGAAYVVFGKAAGFAADLDLADLDGSNGFQISRHGFYDLVGYSVASAGDVNGDGFDDLIIGAPSAAAGNMPGSTYVVFGHEGDFSPYLDLDELGGVDGFHIGGVDDGAGDRIGTSVASAGDVNGDGFDDLIISAGGADPNGSFSGASYVVFGQAGGFPAHLWLGDLDGTNGFQINGEEEGDMSGRSVASAGDFNGDGFDDLIIGAIGVDTVNGSYTGASYVVFGQAEGFDAALELADLDGTNGFQISGQGYHHFGVSVASAGDVNGDGFDDLIIGAPGVDPNGASCELSGGCPSGPERER